MCFTGGRRRVLRPLPAGTRGLYERGLAWQRDREDITHRKLVAEDFIPCRRRLVQPESRLAELVERVYRSQAAAREEKEKLWASNYYGAAPPAQRLSGDGLRAHHERLAEAAKRRAELQEKLRAKYAAPQPKAAVMTKSELAGVFKRVVGES
ncbi:hypothetical protein DIPPA_18346 [Diplonema papillatum]|nr:hypothetical protein DIPPA_18346 [Diplonema papillatum]